jgi:predicted amidohydrolase
MANYVKISTIGPRPPVEHRGTGQEAVDRMIAYWQGKLDQVLPDRPDLIVLPEACDRYPAHSMAERLDYYRARGDQVRDCFRKVARAHHCHIAYAAIREMPDGTWRNSTQLIGREGEVLGIYNKNHPVITETTEGGILCGKDAPLIECDFGRVGCAICFDLNFDEIRLQYVRSQPDLIVFSSMYHGGLMQRYWAYSCRAYMATSIAGPPSAILSPVGDILATTTNYFDFVTRTVNLDCQVVHLDGNWAKLKAMKDEYGPEVSIHDPGYLGSVLISSESDEITCDELIEAFEIERLDEYWARSLAHHHDPQNIEP